jgi:trans-aconitate methyltransferase
MVRFTWTTHVMSAHRGIGSRPTDSASLSTRLAPLIAPGGILAVRMPRNFSEASRMSICDTEGAATWRPRIEPLIWPAHRPGPAGKTIFPCFRPLIVGQR